MECEEQAVKVKHLWGWGWGRYMSRVAPVQLTLDWDPAPALAQVLSKNGLTVQQHSSGRVLTVEGSAVEDIRVEDLRLDVAALGATRMADGKRSVEVLKGTLAAAKRLRRGLLCITEQGWSYEKASFLRRGMSPDLCSHAGFVVANRRPSSA
jgi:hypothetical protein